MQALIVLSRSAATLRCMMRTEDYLDRRWTALILLCAAQFVVVLDASIVNVALPSIGEGLHFSEANLPWVVNGYVIAFGGFLLLGGRAADLLGRRRVFMAGLLVVAVASLAAGFSNTEGQLIAGRVAQGLGAAIISPSALSIVTTLFRDGVERNKARRQREGDQRYRDVHPEHPLPSESFGEDAPEEYADGARRPSDRAPGPKGLVPLDPVAE